MSDTMQDHAKEQTARLNRLMEQHQAFIDAMHKQSAAQARQSTASRWSNKIPDWFIAVGYACGVMSLIILGVPVLLDISHLLAACR